MGNCQQDSRSPDQGELAVHPQSGKPEQNPNQFDNNQLKNTSVRADNDKSQVNKSQMIFNHNAKDRTNKSRISCLNQNEEGRVDDQILPQQFIDEINYNDDEQFNSKFENQQEPQENIFIEEDSFEVQKQDLGEYRKQIEEELRQLEKNPPISIKLPQFNYGEEPKYPQDFVVEMRPAQRLSDGSTYVGEWHGNQIYGRGVKDGEEGKYEGFWVDGVRQGRGRFTFPDGSIYEGEWVSGSSNGIGTYYSVGGTIYHGQWLDDKRHGFGKEKFTNGSSYEGEYYQDVRQGQGVYTWQDGTTYSGEFEDNKLSGKGHMIYSNGRQYKGQYVQGLMEGKGIFQWKDGRVYEGEYYQDRKQGYGILRYPDGKSYEGHWKMGLMDKEGVITMHGKQRKGIWEMGKRIKWLD